MVKFYGEIEYEDKNNTSYEEKVGQLRGLEEKLGKDMWTYDDKYEDIYNGMHDQFLSPDRPDNFDMDKWMDIRKRKTIIICNYIIDRCRVLIRSGDIPVPFVCKNEYDIHKWFRKNRRSLYITNTEYHQGGIDYHGFFEHTVPGRGTYREGISIEIENLSGNFIRHRHDIDMVDMIICYKKDMDIFCDHPKGEKLPILELNYMEM